MRLTFLGAAHEVTGSCFFLQCCGKNILIDCGMEQGPDFYENQEIPVHYADIDCVFLTHAHIDHSGKLPLLYANGFRGQIYATSATTDLCDIMLRDSAHIQEFEAEWRNRKAKRSGGKEFVPLYTMADAIGVMGCFVPCDYNRKKHICDGVDINFVDVGHLLGSASIEIFINEDGVSKKIVFSGDIGNLNQPLIKDPSYITSADYVVMENTYGDRNHAAAGDNTAELAKIIKRTFDRGGNVIIPSFAVGRTQELLYFIRKIKAEKMLPEYQNFTVYVDSPLAIEATNIFKANMMECFDAEAMELVKQGINPIHFEGLKTSVTTDESRNINFDKERKVIISASGMCEAGRIKHHLKHNLWNPDNTILFVGYQAVGTLGRSIAEGAKSVKLFGEPVEVNAEIAVLTGTSGHADKTGLIKWITAFKEKPKRVFVVHGQDEVCNKFVGELEALSFTAVAPYSGDSWDLAKDYLAAAGSRKKIDKTENPRAASESPAFARLINAGKRLMSVIAKNEGIANKDLARFTSQIEALCEKWQR